MNAMHMFLAAAVVASAPLSVSLASRPAADGKPVVEIVEQLEQLGYGPFSELSLDRGRWEVDVYQGDAAHELTVDRQTGQVLSQHRDDAEPRPPHDAQPLSKILRTLLAAGYTDIDEVSFARRYWEVECFRPDGKHEVLVQPATGEVISDRLDD